MTRAVVNEPQKRDSAGRRLRIDIRPMEAAEAENLRLQARAAGWIVTDEIEQRNGIRPCAHGWQFRIRLPFPNDTWLWTKIDTYVWFLFWTEELSEKERNARARRMAAEWERNPTVSV